MGLVHRDVSPQNVLISTKATSSCATSASPRRSRRPASTQMGALKGKLQYMSPEQAWGRPVDPRSDIFSLGAVLFEMLTGRRLFTGDNEISVLEAVRECHVEPPLEVQRRRSPRSSTPSSSRRWPRSPGDRYQHAGEMQQRTRAGSLLAQAHPGAGRPGGVRRASAERAGRTPGAAGEPGDAAEESRPGAARARPRPQRHRPLGAAARAPPRPQRRRPQADAGAPRPQQPAAGARRRRGGAAARGRAGRDGRRARCARRVALGRGIGGRLGRPPGRDCARRNTGLSTASRSGRFLSEPGPAPAAPPAPEPEALEAVAPRGPVVVEEGGGRGRWLLIAAILLVLAAGVAAALYFSIAGPGRPAAQRTPPASAAPSPVAPGEPVVPPADDGSAPVVEPPAAGPDAETTAPGTATKKPPAVPGANAANPPNAAEVAPPAPTPAELESLVEEELARREERIRKKLDAEQKRLEDALARAKAQQQELPPPPPPEGGGGRAKAAAPPPSGGTP